MREKQLHTVSTYFYANIPTEIPVLGIPVGDLFVLLLLFALIVGPLSLLGVILAGLKGWIVVLLGGFLLEIILVSFIRENWGEVVPLEKEVLVEITEIEFSPKVVTKD